MQLLVLRMGNHHLEDITGAMGLMWVDDSVDVGEGATIYRQTYL